MHCHGCFDESAPSEYSPITPEVRIHWVDLCTLIEAILLHEKIAFPVVHDGYAEPLLKPLIDSDVADMWWPQAGILRLADDPKDQSTDRADKIGDDPDHRDAHDAVWIFMDMPDKRYEGLSESSKECNKWDCPRILRNRPSHEE